MKSLKAKNSFETNTDWSENNLLQTYRRHTILAIGMVVFTSIITIWILYKNMNLYRKACQFSFIYYKNGSSVLVQNFENSTNNIENGRVKKTK